MHTNHWKCTCYLRSLFYWRVSVCTYVHFTGVNMIHSNPRSNGSFTQAGSCLRVETRSKLGIWTTILYNLISWISLYVHKRIRAIPGKYCHTKRRDTSDTNSQDDRAAEPVCPQRGKQSHMRTRKKQSRSPRNYNMKHYKSVWDFVNC